MFNEYHSIFFQNYHKALINTIFELLNDNSQSFCLIICPLRGGSLEKFLILCEDVFEIKKLDFDQNLNEKLQDMNKIVDYNESKDLLHINLLRKKIKIYSK